MNQSQILVNIQITRINPVAARATLQCSSRSRPERGGLPHALPGRKTEENACPEGGRRAGQPRQNQPKSMEKACKNEAASSTVELAACFFAAQGRPGGPRVRPAPPLLPRGGASGKPWKPLENPYVSQPARGNPSARRRMARHRRGILLHGSET